MNYNNYKYIISTGCSYGLTGDIILDPTFLLGEGKLHKDYISKYGYRFWEGDDNIISINLNTSSQDSKYQADSIIYTVGILMELGVVSSNIYCYIEWSQWRRYSYHTGVFYDINSSDFDWIDSDIFKIPHISTTSINGNIICDLLISKFNFLRCSKNGSVVRIDNKIYMNPEYVDESTMDTELLSSYQDESSYKKISLSDNDLIEKYISDICRLQYFLKSYSIDYNYIFMQSTLSDWGIDDNQVPFHKLDISENHIERKLNNKIICNKGINLTNPIYDIENVLPHIGFMFNTLDLSNIWFHESDRFRRGGIDEFAIDMNIDCIYFDKWELKQVVNNNLDKLNINSFIKNYAQHPHEIVYLLIFRLASFNCKFFKLNDTYVDFIYEKFIEDVESNKITNNNISISSNQYNKLKSKYKD